MNLYTYIHSGLKNLQHYLQKARTLNHLQSLSDHQLQDIGISRVLLNQGVAAYPWNLSETKFTLVNKPVVKPAATVLKFQRDDHKPQVIVYDTPRLAA